jgi:hypothetical protein
MTSALFYSPEFLVLTNHCLRAVAAGRAELHDKFLGDARAGVAAQIIGRRNSQLKSINATL